MVLVGIALAACGGSGNEADSGINKTYLRVEATDPDGDTLHYQWRVTAGRIQNRDANETVWTMPDGAGLHFAYVVVSDAKGGYVEQQYAVSSDALGTAAPVRQAVSYVPRPVTDFAGNAGRLRFLSATDARFTPPAGGTAAPREVYLPDIQVQVQDGGNRTVFSGLSDLSGEVSLPKLAAGTYSVRCAPREATLADCGSLVINTEARVYRFPVPRASAPEHNLRLFGHIGFADGGVCTALSEYFGLQVSASVQLLQADGQVLGPPLRVNRFGDYALDAAVPVRANLKLEVRCESYRALLDVPAATQPAGYVDSRIELSHQIPNRRPSLVKMVANGGDGNVRGRMIVAEAGAASNGLPGSQQFLTHKGRDTRLSACMYYRALGAARDCDAQGRLIDPISFDDWKRRHQFTPYKGTNTEFAADYVNQMDLNLVRRMIATQSGPQTIAFHVCNHPGPEDGSQREVDQVTAAGLANERLVACVAMEWSVSPGVNGGLPFTKFLVFANDGSLIPSVNLDGRGEKFVPGICVACHGGTQYNGRFPEAGDPSPLLGSRFLAFDTGNYLFASAPQLGEAAQSNAFYELNQLVQATEPSARSPTSTLIQGWYSDGTKTLDKKYVPPAWLEEERTRTPDASLFYREVIGASCRTCHVSLGPNLDWDATVLMPIRARTHICGGTADIADNASMPNALSSRDRVMQRVRADPKLAALMITFLGCDAPLPDPAYPRR